MTAEAALASRARSAAMWSGVATIVLRLGSLVVGIILARILTPAEFGVYAVALTIQAIMMTVADLGLSAEMIRTSDPRRVAPTLTTIGALSGTTLAVLTAVSSPALAQLLGAPQAAGAIAVLSITLLLAGLTVVPYGLLQRRFAQRALFSITVVDFVVSTAVTLALIAAGWGVLSLAVGRVAGHLTSTLLQFRVTRVRLRFAWDRALIGPVLRFAGPIAGANLLSWGLLNIDNLVLARIAGTTALGFYVLAFNVSNWPMNALSQVVRSVAMPLFSRTGDQPASVATLTGLVGALALPAGGLLAVLAAPLIEVVYGPRWLLAAPVLAALGLYGGLRVIFDVFAGYLYSRGASRPVLMIQIAQLLVLVVAMIPATMRYGIVGAGWVHAAVALAVVFPGYLIALAASGVPSAPVVAALRWPALGTAVVCAVAAGVTRLVDQAWLGLLLGGLAASASYFAVVGRWFFPYLAQIRRSTS